MSNSYDNISLCLREALETEEKLLAALYSPTACRSPQQLHQLLETELGELMRIKIQINEISKEAALEGMRQDGVEYPLILWAEEIAPKLPSFSLHALSDQAPIVNTTPESFDEKTAKSSPLNRNIIYAVTGAGAVLTVTGLSLNPVNRLLLSMGIVLTATGLVLLVKEIYFDKKALDERKPSMTPDTNAAADTEFVTDLLKKNLKQNIDVIRKWNADLYHITIDAMQKTEGKQV